MIRLDELKLSDLLPSSIRDVKEISAMAAALDKELQSITACINEIVLLPRIDELPEDIIDSLAWQLHVDFYEPLGLDLSKKRALVKSSLSWHRRKGTKSVLEEIIRILFFQDFKIEEWFEYGGMPYFFRLTINDYLLDKDKFDELLRAVFELKNVRSWLDYVTTKLHSSNILRVGTRTRSVYSFTQAKNGVDFTSVKQPLLVASRIRSAYSFTQVKNNDVVSCATERLRVGPRVRSAYSFATTK